MEESPPQNMTMLIPWSWTCCLQNSEQNMSPVCQPPGLWYFVIAANMAAAAAAAAAKSLQSCLTLSDPIDGSPPGFPVPGILQTRTLGCHFLLQCIKVKSESEVAQSCPTPSDPMGCSLPGSSARQEYWSRVPSPSLKYGLRYYYWYININHSLYL